MILKYMLEIILFIALCVTTICFFRYSQRTRKELYDSHLKFEEKINQLQMDHQNFLVKLQEQHEIEKESAKERALTASRNKIKGNVSETFCPFQKDFPYQATDCSFLGQPIDFIVFKNVAAYRHKETEIDDIEIIFVEVKTGKSSLTRGEKAIQHAIASGRVRFETYHFPQQTNTTPHVKLELSQNTTIDITPPQLLDFSAIDALHSDVQINDNIRQQRQKYPRAYRRWGEQEMTLLLQKIDDGHSLDDLSVMFGRQESAIRSRLQKMEIDVGN